MKGHKFNNDILCENGISGTFGDNIFNEDAYHIGRCLGSLVADRSGDRVIIATDSNNDNNKRILNSIADGLIECGMEVVDIGSAPKAVLDFAEYFLDANASIMISTIIDNKINISLSLEKKQLSGKSIKMLQKLANSGMYANGNLGFMRKQNITDEYINQIIKEYKEHNEQKENSKDKKSKIERIISNIQNNLNHKTKTSI